MKMRPSRVLEKLRAGQTAICFKHNLADARAGAGFDCAWVDLEHVADDLTVIEQAVYGGK